MRCLLKEGQETIKANVKEKSKGETETD